MKKILMTGLVGALLAGLSPTLFGAVVVVPGTANIFESGRDANGGNPGGGTYAVLGASFTSGTVTINSVTGTTNCGAGAPCVSPPIGPDGSSLVFTVGSTTGTNIPTSGVGTGISGIVFTGREMFLVGVFLDNSTPSGFGPFADNYTSASTQANFAPLLFQTFFVGDGRTGTGSGAFQTFQAPVGATRLFLGFADSFDNFVGAPSAYGDNVGSLTVDINTSALVTGVPEPGTVIMMGLGLVGLALLRRKIA